MQAFEDKNKNMYGTWYVFKEVSYLSISIYCVNCIELYAHSFFGKDSNPMSYTGL